MPNAAAKALDKEKASKAGKKDAGSKAFGLLMNKRVIVTLKTEEGYEDAPVVYEGNLRSFDNDRIILEDDFDYTPVEIPSIDTCNIKK
jgi:pantoate kinase